MKKIYLILAHQNPLQLERLVKKLDDGSSCFYIHIDLKSDIDQFMQLLNYEKVTLIKEREVCIWASFNIVKATLNLIKNVLSNHDSGFCILISGNDYPIKSNEFIDSFLKTRINTIFIDANDAYSNWPDFNERIEAYRINLSYKRYDALSLYPKFKLRLFKRFFLGQISIIELFKVSFIRRKLNLDLKYYGGSQWWAMDISYLSEIFNYVNKNRRKLFSFFKYSYTPDEFFFHSIIMHLFGGHNNPIQIHDTITYVDWKRTNCTLPVTFTSDDFGELMRLPDYKLFARKFDAEIDDKILNMIDHELDGTSY
jgi:hypothetical protein